MDLLIGPDGKKMSKTGGNTIPIDMEPNLMFTKLMEIQDHLILDYFKLASVLSLEAISAYEQRLTNGEHPKTLKMELAKNIVEFYHNTEASHHAHEYFLNVISGKMRPDE